MRSSREARHSLWFRCSLCTPTHTRTTAGFEKKNLCVYGCVCVCGGVGAAFYCYGQRLIMVETLLAHHEGGRCQGILGWVLTLRRNESFRNFTVWNSNSSHPSQPHCSLQHSLSQKNKFFCFFFKTTTMWAIYLRFFKLDKPKIKQTFLITRGIISITRDCGKDSKEHITLSSGFELY